MSTQPPLGKPLAWTPARRPEPVELRGGHVLLRPLDPRADASQLHAVSHPPGGDAAIWTYLPIGPFADGPALRGALEHEQAGGDRVFFAIAPLAGELAQGVCSYLAIRPNDGVLEIGHVWFSAALARTSAASEAIGLLLRHAFDELGYRRVEWKCNSLNARSRRAAARFGFTFEGRFRNHMVVKGRNRDTDWFAITVERWPAIRRGFDDWLASENFDADGVQRQALSVLIEQARAQGS